jgi:hypothetical protein
MLQEAIKPTSFVELFFGDIGFIGIRFLNLLMAIVMYFMSKIKNQVHSPNLPRRRRIRQMMPLLGFEK